ncbi:hypothetical protein QTG54_000902 [Skeletonema marinoi]|uniref:Protein TIC 214 n=1 Tax=Skeletonema marinoi TaxID=267567 RepID=A0AAD9DKQ5_9STRA|nr:hypothetical protein QTG54_000902 [Skeletonema marinoi]
MSRCCSHKILIFFIVLVFLGECHHAFILPTHKQLHVHSTQSSDLLNTNILRRKSSLDHIRRHNKLVHTSSTAINNGIIIDVDDNFFTVAFFSIGLFYSLGKAYNRYLLEEVAFEQRRLEARERRLEEDPTLSELDLRREETANWPSVYARKYRGEGETTASEGERDSKWRKSRVSVMDREDDGDDDDYGMSDDQISEFESTYGVEYDPYYDEPYEESELPVGKYKEDKSYGDRRYENGEVFYKDDATGLFYRQGSRPRQKKFWDLSS